MDGNAVFSAFVGLMLLNNFLSTHLPARAYKATKDSNLNIISTKVLFRSFLRDLLAELLTSKVQNCNVHNTRY